MKRETPPQLRQSLEVANVTDKMREEFETYRDKRNAQLEEEGHAPGSKWHVTNAHYPTWQESREALVIELPAPAVAGGNCIRDHAIRDVLEAAGLKVKP